MLADAVAPTGAASLLQRKSVPSSHMQCMITAILRDTATVAFLMPPRFMMRNPQLRNGLALRQRRSG